jgi:glycosyltransferase involved in cell wall biosynthesis
VIPAYNAAGWVARAVDSALAQTHSQCEILVVDDGSTDDTPALLAGYGNAIRVLRQDNGGLSSARNTGIRAARGEFVAFLDADDYWLPDKLSRQVALLQANDTLGFCSTHTQVETTVGDVSDEWRCPRLEGPLLPLLFSHNAAVSGSGSSVMVRRRLFDRVGMFDTGLRSLEDIDMWMRLAAVSSYACIDEPLTVIVKSPLSMSGNLDVMRASALQVMRKNRHLLEPDARGRFWRSAYAGVLADYAKWEYRAGRRLRAMAHLLEGLGHSPVDRGRLLLGLLAAMAMGRPL